MPRPASRSRLGQADESVYPARWQTSRGLPALLACLGRAFGVSTPWSPAPTVLHFRHLPLVSRNLVHFRRARYGLIPHPHWSRAQLTHPSPRICYLIVKTRGARTHPVSAPVVRDQRRTVGAVRTAKGSFPAHFRSKVQIYQWFVLGKVRSVTTHDIRALATDRGLRCYTVTKRTPDECKNALTTLSADRKSTPKQSALSASATRIRRFRLDGRWTGQRVSSVRDSLAGSHRMTASRRFS